MSKKLAVNTVFSGMEALTIMVLAFVNVALLIEAYEIGGYGVYAFLMIFSIWGGMNLFDFGLEGVIVHKISKSISEDKLNHVSAVAWTGLLLLCLLGAIASASVYFVLEGFSDSFFKGDAVATARVKDSIIWVTLSLPFQFMSMAGNGVLQGYNRFDISKSIGMLFSVVNLVVIYYCTSQSYSFAYLFQLLFYASMLRGGFTLVIAYSRLQSTKNFRQIVFQESKEMLHTGSLLFVSRIIGFIFNFMDKFIISSFLGAAALGIYEIIRRLAAPVSVLNSVLVSALLPDVTRKLTALGLEPVKKMLHEISIMLVFLVSLCSIGIFLNSESILDWWLGESFKENIEFILLIPLAWMFINTVPSIYSTIALAIGEVKSTIKYGVVGSVINLSLSLLLVERMGISGVLLGTLCAHFVIFTMYLSLVARTKLSSVAAVFQIYIKFICCSVFMYVMMLGIKSVSDIFSSLIWGLVVTCMIIGFTVTLFLRREALSVFKTIKSY